ncbi:DUF4870 domain-containing protein [Desertihabitans brevis]|uniref:DUF4870 domain-containing protein n=1 Tax=Desertihabitans brevis TaxID=2268447 RepID=A0A367YR93_9ACTN|nr:DUF4870 domain-containing protein [Desertihabitans brevis]RCK68415.1 DUF4870 domain-containing protein [Desertihabitans brevis]
MSTPYRTRADGDERTLAVAAHLSTIVAMIISAGWLSFVGPLVVWLLFRGRSPFVRLSAAGSFNFNIWAWIINVVAWVCAITVVLFPLAVILWVVAGLMTVVCHVLGAVRASRGVLYTYPAQIKILH